MPVYDDPDDNLSELSDPTGCIDRPHLHVNQCYLAGVREGRRLAYEDRTQTAERPAERPQTPAPAPEAVSGEISTSAACREGS